MINVIKNLLGLGPKVDYKDLLKKGGVIVDVRTKGEFQSGHIRGSINIPLQNLSGHLSQLKKNKPVITCCASGIRSASAKSILKSQGFEEVYNGGSWASLQYKIS